MKSILHVFASWKMAAILLLGFSCGIPLALTFATLQAWMASEKVDLTVIGVFSLVGMPYALKFLWAPLMDRYVPPFLGRRRGWMLITQIGLVIGIAAMAFSSPSQNPAMVATLAVIVAFFSASQDIVVDAYKTEILTKDEFGVGSGLYVMGYRIAMITSGAVALIMADHLPWKTVYLVMAAIMATGVLTSVLAPEPQIEEKPPRTLTDAVVLPFIEFFKRKGAIEVLIFMILYKLDVALTLAMITPFMLDIGFSKTDIGAVTKGFGMVSVIAGTLVGGTLMVKLKMERSLWIFGITQAASGLAFMWLAHLGHNYPAMVAAVAIENFCSGMGIAAFSAFMMSLCDKRFTATQYALLSSFMSLSRYVAGAPSGYLAKTLGWEYYFLVCVLVGIPGLLLLMRYKKWSIPA
ncbi:MAG: AmpG family muropeptide MFS transporter [Bdellovibrionota bacterium]